MRAQARRASTIAAPILLLLVLFSAVLPARAQGRGDPFTIRGIEVDQSADSVARARDQALLVGQHRALNRLLQRLVVRADLPRLPELQRNEMLRLVEGIQVADEKSSATRYIAELIVSFRKDRVRAFLRGNDVRFAETQAKPALVLPVLEEGGERLLFDDANPWREAWLAQPPARDSLLPLVLPLGDLADVAAIGPNDAAFGDEARIGRMAERYQVDSVLVALARLGRDAAGGRPTADVSVRRYGGIGARVLIESFSAQAGDSLDDLLARAVAGVTASLEEDWKQETASAHGAEQRLSVQVPLRDFQDWLTIRERLLRNALIRRVEILSIRPDDAQLAIEYTGQASQLQVALAQVDLELREIDGFWMLGQRGRLSGIAAEPVPPPAAIEPEPPPATVGAPAAPETE